MTYEELINKADIVSTGIAKIKYQDISAKILNPIKDEFCVYMLECSNEIVYIGQTENIIHRLRQHKYKLKFDYVYIGCMNRECTYRQMLFMESYLVGIAEPILNFSDFTRQTFKTKELKEILNNITYIGQ